jgi:hypothetical protein
MIHRADQLAHLRSSINQYYIGERIHQLFLLRVNITSFGTKALEVRYEKITPREMWEYEYVPERPLIIYSLFPKSKSPEP